MALLAGSTMKTGGVMVRQEILPKKMEAIDPSTRELFLKAVEVSHHDNIDYAIELFKDVVIKEPYFQEARNELRKYEKMRKKGGWTSCVIRAIISFFWVQIGQFAFLRRRYNVALNCAEEGLSQNIKSLSALRLLSRTAGHLNANFIVIEGMELAVEFHPKDINVLKSLALVYRKLKLGRDELRIRQKIAKFYPDNLDIQSEVRTAAAMATMEEESWSNKDLNFRDHLKDSKESRLLDLEGHFIHSDDDASDMLVELKKRLGEAGDNIELLRRIGDLHQIKGEHRDALFFYGKILKKNGFLDPDSDKAIEKSILFQLNNKIDGLKKNQSKTDSKELCKLRKLRYRYKRKKALHRVKRYPNDFQLRNELGEIYWSGNEVDKAIKEFQISVTSPHYKLNSLIFLGKCFKWKKHYDIAIQEFNSAMSCGGINKKHKLEIMYYLGLVYEECEEKEKASDLFKKIYIEDSNYRDVSIRVKSYYG